MSTVIEAFQTMAWGPARESDETAIAWLDRHVRLFGHFVDNRWVGGSSGQTIETLNPANRQPLAKIAKGTAEDVDQAVQAARRAAEGWSASPGHVRARYLYALARQVQKHSRLLSVLESLDNGKPIRESRDVDVPLVARHFAYHAGWAQLMEDALPEVEPLGVVGQIIPWNFPLLMLAWKIAPALAMGNTVVLKPAEFTPLTALAFGELVEAAKLPPGVVNIVTGDGQTGSYLVEHPAVDKIAFTGSTEVGRIIRRATAGMGKRLSLELGGKSPFVVFDDADADSAVEGLVDAIWFNQGEVCCAGSRLLVQESIEQQFLELVRMRMSKLRLGDPLDKAIDLGAIVAPVQLERITSLVAAGKAEGAIVWQPQDACPTGGWYYPPTLVSGVGPASELAQVEIFGPVLVAMSFKTPQEAVALANNTQYGLAASVWTQDLDQAFDVAHQIRAGTVWINSTNLFDASSGFGGYRESGFGREGGREGLFEYVRQKPRPKPAPPAKRTQSGGGGQHSKMPPAPSAALPVIDRTPKLFIGGKQVRPDSGYSRIVYRADGRPMAEVGDGNRKDIRNAVEAAVVALPGWAATTAYNRSQILYYLAENLSARDLEFADRIRAMTGKNAPDADREVETAIERLFASAAWADKFDGQVHTPPMRGSVMAIPEPMGVIGIASPIEGPLSGLVTLIGPALATGNTVVAIPSEEHALSGIDLYQLLETSDVPSGVVNIVTGDRDTLAKVLSEHDDVDAIWYFGSVNGRHTVEYASAGNMKRTWCQLEEEYPVDDVPMEELLREATQTKNIWIPWGA
jgi:aldehyde dehydrogenase (NAD+)